jgi:hypothetical protein
MAAIIDLLEEYIANTNTVIVKTDIKRAHIDTELSPYDVNEDLEKDYPELSSSLYSLSV